MFPVLEAGLSCADLRFEGLDGNVVAAAGKHVADMFRHLARAGVALPSLEDDSTEVEQQPCGTVGQAHGNLTSGTF